MTSLSLLLPAAGSIRELLGMLTGRDVAVREQRDRALALGDACVVADFRTDDETLVAVALCDIALAVRLGAALALVPKGVWSEAEKAKALTPELADNVYEVLNIASALLNADDRPHVRLTALHHPAAQAPQESVALAAATNRIDCLVDVDGYGSGMLALLAA